MASICATFFYVFMGLSCLVAAILAYATNLKKMTSKDTLVPILITSYSVVYSLANLAESIRWFSLEDNFGGTIFALMALIGAAFFGYGARKSWLINRSARRNGVGEN